MTAHPRGMYGISSALFVSFELYEFSRGNSSTLSNFLVYIPYMNTSVWRQLCARISNRILNWNTALLEAAKSGIPRDQHCQQHDALQRIQQHASYRASRNPALVYLILIKHSADRALLQLSRGRLSVLPSLTCPRNGD